MFILQHQDLDVLISALKSRGYRVVGPTLSDDTVVYDDLNSAADLPIGCTDDLERGHYRLRRSESGTYFGTTVGPHSWKKYLFPPRVKLFSIQKRGRVLELEAEDPQQRPEQFAFFGVRPCELAAIALQDKVFMGKNFADRTYTALRRGVFIVAVNCTRSGGTCFCDSMGTGPKAEDGFDLALTEVEADGRHFFVVDVGTPRGTEVMNDVPRTKAGQSDIELARKLVSKAKAGMKRSVTQEGLRQFIAGNLESGYWDEVSRRCLLCANCTLVCPTCFCSTVEDTTDLSGEHAERWRRWDSCFTMEFAKVTGGNFRPSPRARYRQWLTHKFSSWIDQFGVAGCVGCGRCITWCPVGIDITAELEALRGHGARAET